MTENSKNCTPSNPIPVTEKMIQVYEKSTGFTGIGEIMLRAGLWTIAEERLEENT